MEFTCSCISCICEVSLCIVSWLSLNFCAENLSTRNSCALFISPISCIFRIWVSRSAFCFIDNSCCWWNCSLRDSIYPWWASYSLSISLLLELIDTTVKRSHLMFLLHKFRSCLIKQRILVSIKKWFPNICRVRKSKNRKNTTLETISRFVTSVSFGKRVLTRFSVATKTSHQVSLKLRDL